MATHALEQRSVPSFLVQKQSGEITGWECLWTRPHPKPKKEIGPLSRLVWLLVTRRSPRTSSIFLDVYESKTRVSSGSRRDRDRDRNGQVLRGLGLCPAAPKMAPLSKPGLTRRLPQSGSATRNFQQANARG